MCNVKVSETGMVFNHRFLPDKLNPFGVVHGGHIMALMDHVTGITGYRFARMRIVTAAVEHMSFHAPVHAGKLLICHTCVNRVWDSAMEIGVRGVEEDFLTGEQKHVLTCYMTFVGLDDAGHPSPLPLVVPETDEDRRRMADAARRMATSVMERKIGFAQADTLELTLEPDSYGICRLPRSVAPQMLTRFFSEKYAVRTADALFAVLHKQDEVIVVLKEPVLGVLAKDSPEAALESGYRGLRMDAPRALLPAPINGVALLLDSHGIKGISISMPGSDCLLLREERLEQALGILQGAGYAIRLSGQ